MPPEEVSGLIVAIQAVQDAANSGTLGQALKGRKLALLIESDTAHDAGIARDSELFNRAASEMGAQVTRLLPGLSHATPANEFKNTARMLGRLYDAIECQGMDLGLVQQIALYAGVPVYHGLASARHRTAPIDRHLAEHAQGGVAYSDERCRTVQAVLMGTVAR